MKDKSPADPLVVNLSLGLMPPVELLPEIWYGTTPPSQTLSNREMLVLQRPLQRLIKQLVENNCLIVAAAGNDSLESEIETGRRFQPRIPARFDDVLGVAATEWGHQAAPYSNIGDVPVLGNALANVGGGVASDGLHPRAGVVGIYAAPTFPDSVAHNDTGWAEWSGTSFATALTSGLAANFWATRLEHATPDAMDILDDLNDAVRLGGPSDVAGLVVPPVTMHESWLP
ncbi:MAG: S8/S53 family peptidase [Chloroflexi bacterium]|nr:S8/S53 family peptidase [Chloroflexota bacterium]